MDRSIVYVQRSAAVISTSFTIVMVGRNAGTASQHEFKMFQNVSRCLSRSSTLHAADTPVEGLTPRMISIVIAQSFRRCAYGG